MIEIVLEFFYGLFSIAGAKKTKGIKNPLFILVLVGWFVLIFCLTLIFG